MGSQLNVVAMQRILQFTEDQKRALLSHRCTYIAHMTQLSKSREQLLQQLHNETALELSNGELEARQTCEDQILRHLENCTVEANRRYFHYVGAVGHDVSPFFCLRHEITLSTLLALPAPLSLPSPPHLHSYTSPPPAHTSSSPSLSAFCLPLPFIHACVNHRWNHNECKCHHVYVCCDLAYACIRMLLPGRCHTGYTCVYWMMTTKHDQLPETQQTNLVIVTREFGHMLERPRISQDFVCKNRCKVDGFLHVIGHDTMASLCVRGPCIPTIARCLSNWKCPGGRGGMGPICRASACCTYQLQPTCYIRYRRQKLIRLTGLGISSVTPRQVHEDLVWTLLTQIAQGNMIFGSDKLPVLLLYWTK